MTDKNKTNLAIDASKPEKIHSGHRGRMRSKYQKGGLEMLEIHEIIEILLYFSYVRKDVNELAHKIADAYGDSLIDILNAKPHDLVKRTGVSETAAVNFNIISDLIKLYNTKALENTGTDARDLRSAEDFIISQFAGLKEERLLLFTLGGDAKINSSSLIQRGEPDSVLINMNKIAEIIFKKKSTAVILAHNHINRLTLPTSEDILITKRIMNTLSELGIRLLEHYIVSGSEIRGIKSYCL